MMKNLYLSFLIMFIGNLYSYSQTINENIMFSDKLTLIQSFEIAYDKATSYEIYTYDEYLALVKNDTLINKNNILSSHILKKKKDIEKFNRFLLKDKFFYLDIHNRFLPKCSNKPTYVIKKITKNNNYLFLFVRFQCDIINFYYYENDIEKTMNFIIKDEAKKELYELFLTFYPNNKYLKALINI